MSVEPGKKIGIAVRDLRRQIYMDYLCPECLREMGINEDICLQCGHKATLEFQDRYIITAEQLASCSIASNGSLILIAGSLKVIEALADGSFLVEETPPLG